MSIKCNVFPWKHYFAKKYEGTWFGEEYLERDIDLVGPFE